MEYVIKPLPINTKPFVVIFVISEYVYLATISRNTPTAKFSLDSVKQTDFICLGLKEENPFNTLTEQVVEKLCSGKHYSPAHNHKVSQQMGQSIQEWTK